MSPRTADTKDTREDILKIASALLQTRGFSAFSYWHIAETLKVKPAAIHYHFATKADLGVALIERFRARYRRWMDEADARRAVLALPEVTERSSWGQPAWFHRNLVARMWDDERLTVRRSRREPRCMSGSSRAGHRCGHI